MKKETLVIIAALSTFGCGRSFDSTTRLGEGVIPAVEFSRAVKAGKASEYSIHETTHATQTMPQILAEGGAAIPIVPVSANAGDLATVHAQREQQAAAEYQRAALGYPQAPQNDDPMGVQLQELQPKGDPKFTRDGFSLKASVNVPNEQIPMPPQRVVQPVPPPPGSSAPYYMGQMTSNPSLWPDEGQGAFLLRDMRAIQPMDIVTVTINEQSDGMKRAETDAQSNFSLVAAISNFFGEELEFQSNNAGLDPTNLINASTQSNYEGEGETRRVGSLRANMSAVVLEVLPNGLLRVEGTRIMSVDHEEEIMVISGLVRPRDVDAQNRVESSRIANMRIDFYGRGVVAEQTFPGWAARILRYVWPF